jgi:hypothetical protein
MPRDQSATVNSASRGPGLTGKPVTESYLSLCVRAQIPAQLRLEVDGAAFDLTWVDRGAQIWQLCGVVP